MLLTLLETYLFHRNHNKAEFPACVTSNNCLAEGRVQLDCHDHPIRLSSKLQVCKAISILANYWNYTSLSSTLKNMVEI